jgi:glutamate racemase
MTDVMKRVSVSALLGLVLLLANSVDPGPATQDTAQLLARLDQFFKKESVTIAVTDSGLGGLSVMAEAVNRIKAAGIFKKADFVFFNALFSSEGGYNSLKSRVEKVRIFNSALESLAQTCRPDLILIACNTLSVVYADTPFARRTRIPVIGIVGAGLELMAQGLQADPTSFVIIFGTPTTISEGTYQRELERDGFSAGQIIAQSCPELESFIERNHAGDDTEMLISACVSEAVQKLPSPRPPVLASLNCTHYGYSLPLWEKAFAEAGVKPVAILNPNSEMLNFLVQAKYAKRFPQKQVTARVISMVEIGPEKIASLGKWLQRVSPETAEALRTYQHIPELFRVK